MPLPANAIAYKVVAISSRAWTAGNRVNIAHGLGFRPHINACIPICQVADNSTDTAQAYAVVKTDSTNVVIKASRAVTSAGILLILLETDVGGSNDLTSAGAAASDPD